MKKSRKGLIMVLTLGLIMAMGLTSVVFGATTGSTDATIEFTTDSEVNKLDLVSAPSFTFGSHDLPGEGEAYEAVSVDNPLKVSDTRGSFEGWEVKAQMSNFSTSAVSNSMPGATLTLADGVLSREGNGVSGAPSISDTIALTAGSESTTKILSADDNEGIGTWLAKWQPTDVVLQLLDTPAVGANAATINWVVESAPIE